MKKSTERILTTHCGSLARPTALLDLMDARLRGDAYDEARFAAEVKRATREVVQKQVECGIDVVTDGEQAKASFNNYVTERLGGIEVGGRSARERVTQRLKSPESEAFPEYYQAYYAEHSSRVGTARPMTVIGPITYVGQTALQRDIDNLKSALLGLESVEAFLPSIAPGFFANSSMFQNVYYGSDKEAHVALAEALRQEYLGIVDAGLILQIDDPSLTRLYGGGAHDDVAARRSAAGRQIDVLNHALRGIPAEKIRYHTCYGINEGPRVFDIPLASYVDLMLAVNAGAYSFEAANPRHEHEYRVWAEAGLASGKILIPGVITHTCAIVEHPAWIAERIVRYAKLVGREQVIAGVDCGFSSQATNKPEIHPTIVWAKFQAMAEGARLATKQLW